MWHFLWLLSVYCQKMGLILNTLYRLFSKHTSPHRNMSNMCEAGDWRGREWKRGSEGGVKAFCSGAPTAPHIFHFPPSWKDQVIEKETIQQPRLHRCQWKASEILEYYTLGPAFVFLSHGAYGKKKDFIMTTPEKCFPIRLMHHCQRRDEAVLFLFGWATSMERQQAAERK